MLTFYLKYYIIYDYKRGKSMEKSNIDNQMIMAKENYKYFVRRLIVSVLLILVKLLIVLVIGFIIDSVIFTFFELLYTFYLLYEVVNVLNYYFDIIQDIKNMLNIPDNFIEAYLNQMHNLILSKITK